MSYGAFYSSPSGPLYRQIFRQQNCKKNHQMRGRLTESILKYSSMAVGSQVCNSCKLTFQINRDSIFLMFIVLFLNRWDCTALLVSHLVLIRLFRQNTFKVLQIIQQIGENIASNFLTMKAQVL